MATSTSTGTTKAKTPAIPRHSASLVLVNARNEVLMVQRNPDSRSFAGVHVFPGGNYDNEQDSSLQVTAIRETFEETGVLLAKHLGMSDDTSLGLSDSVLDAARKAIHALKLSFASFLSEHRLEADTTALWPFTQWVTPPPVPRRFHTRFYIAFLPQSSSFQPDLGSSETSGSTEICKHQLPTPDGGLEVLSATFLHPGILLSEFHRGEISLMPPQFYILSALADILTQPCNENTREQRDKVLSLARGTFGRMLINPRGMATARGGADKDEQVKGANKSDGRVVLTFEGDETRGGTKGRLHRVVMRPGKGGTPRDLTLIRNFNIFSEIEQHLFPRPPPPSPSTSPSSGISYPPFPLDIPTPNPIENKDSVSGDSSTRGSGTKL